MLKRVYILIYWTSDGNTSHVDWLFQIMAALNLTIIGGLINNYITSSLIVIIPVILVLYLIAYMKWTSFAEKIEKEYNLENGSEYGKEYVKKPRWLYALIFFFFYFTLFSIEMIIIGVFIW